MDCRATDLYHKSFTKSADPPPSCTPKAFANFSSGLRFGNPGFAGAQMDATLKGLSKGGRDPLQLFQSCEEYDDIPT